MRKIKTWKDPYGEGFSVCKKRNITLEPGLTVLIGCNGAGKTTLLHNIMEELKQENIPVMMYDNLKEGGSETLSEACFNNEIAFVATAACSSEGENILMNLRRLVAKLKLFIDTGEFIKNKNFHKLFKDAKKEDEKENNSKERWILLDAIDSGYSIDNIIDLKRLFNAIFESTKDKEIYIIISANEYELVRGEKCFDVWQGKYISIKSYDAYRKAILKSRKQKDKRFVE